MRDACDCHAHVCGPESRYPYSPHRLYTPEDALPTDYRHMLDSLGMERGVLVQPSIYGTDNRALLDALAQDPVRLRGVAVVPWDISAKELEKLHAQGVYQFHDGRRVEEDTVIEQHPRVRQLSWSWEERRGDDALRSYSVDLVTGHATARKRSGDGVDSWDEHLDGTANAFVGVGFMYAVKNLTERLDKAMATMAQRKDFVEKMNAQLLGVRYMGRAEFRNFYAQQDALFKRIIDKLGIYAAKGTQ